MAQKPMPMRLSSRYLTLPLILLFFCCHDRIAAQDTLGLRIDALTSAERDALVAAANRSGQLEAVYACVPAGVIVFVDRGPAGSRSALRTMVLATVAPVVPAQRIRPNEVTLRAAEAACGSVRGQ